MNPNPEFQRNTEESKPATWMERARESMRSLPELVGEAVTHIRKLANRAVERGDEAVASLVEQEPNDNSEEERLNFCADLEAIQGEIELLDSTTQRKLQELDPEAIPEMSEHQYHTLSERDQLYLFEHGKRLIEQLIKIFPDNLPDCIVLPDTSGRPLASLFRPVLQKVAEARGCAVPQFVFFKVYNDQWVEIWRLAWDRYMSKKNPDYTPPKSSASNSEEALREAKEEEWARKLAVSYAMRGTQIREYLHQKGIDSPRIIMIDDYLSSGHSKDIISYGFDDEIQLFTLLADPEADEDGRIAYLPQVENGEIEAKPNVIGGEYNPYYHGGPEWHSNLGYDYHYAPDYRQALGVTKYRERIDEDGRQYKDQTTNMLSERIDPSYNVVESIRRLRQDMKVMGERIADAVDVS